MNVRLLLLLGFFSPFLLFAQPHKLEQATIVFAAEMPEISSGDLGLYPQLSTLLAKQRRQQGATFFFFGGGSLGPSILSSLDQGSHIIDLLNTLEPDAMGVAKREFSFFSANLSTRAYEAAFPLVASNIIESATMKPIDGLVSYSVAYQAGYKVGFISIIDQAGLDDYTVKEVSLIDAQRAIEKTASTLRAQGVNIIALHYSGYYPFINQLLANKTINLSLHKDESYNKERYKGRVYHDNDIFIRKSSNAAVIKLSWDKQQQESLNIDWRVVDITKLPAEPKMTKQVMDYINRLSLLNEVQIGLTEVRLDTRRDIIRRSETTFGNFVADSLRNYADGQIAIVNSGSVRGNRTYERGTLLTRHSIANELPFRSRVSLIKVSGLQLRQAMENGFSLIEQRLGRFPMVSGMTVKYNSSAAPGNRVKSILINGLPLQETGFYRVATTDYLAAGGDGYTMFINAQNVIDQHLKSRLVLDVIIEKIIKEKVIRQPIERRLIDLSGQ